MMMRRKSSLRELRRSRCKEGNLHLCTNQKKRKGRQGRKEDLSFVLYIKRDPI
jgi:hypothetical protein